MSHPSETSPHSNPARDVLREMWVVRRSEAVADLDSLISLLTSLVSDPSDTAVRSRAQRHAHQLVGVFGVFGFTEIKNDMARIDIELSDPTIPIDGLLARVDALAARLP